MEEERLGCYPFGELETCRVYNQRNLHDLAFGEGGDTTYKDFALKLRLDIIPF